MNKGVYDIWYIIHSKHENVVHGYKWFVAGSKFVGVFPTIILEPKPNLATLSYISSLCNKMSVGIANYNVSIKILL